MPSYIRITRIPYEEPYHLHLVFEVSNGKQFWSFDSFENAHQLARFADTLEVFPRHSSDVFIHESGSERPEDNWGYYFKFMVFTVLPTGQCAIQLRFNNNKALPNRELFEFCISAEPSQIENLGRLFRHFSKLEDELLEWLI